MAEKGNVKLPESNKKGPHIQGKEWYRTEKAPDGSNLWGITGRQEIMQMRRLWQLRIPLK